MTILDAEMRDTLATMQERGGVLTVDRMGHVIVGGLRVEASGATWLRIVS